MSDSIQQMACPVCNGSVIFDAQKLIQGVQFTCTACNASIGLEPQSRAAAEKALEELAAIKAKIKK